MRPILSRAMEVRRLRTENVRLRQYVERISYESPRYQMIGAGLAMQRVVQMIEKVAPTNSTVLVRGASGTGKELVARALHHNSTRRAHPLVTVNSAALQENLLESELFGHEKGAFTGASAQKKGKVEVAEGGTLFLDEIGELAAGLQAKLMRVLQEHEFERVGGSASIKTDVRVIAATNRDLLKCAKEGTFREDLYYRLNVFPIQLPPLRQRNEDIPLLVSFLIKRFASRIGKRIDGVSRPTMQRLLQYPWPGNIRELENILERAVILAAGPILDFDPGPSSTTTPDARQQEGSLLEVEKNHILAVLQQTNWVIDGPRGAARILGLHPNTLRSRLKKLRISRQTTNEVS